MLEVVLALVIVGVALYLIERYVPMSPPIRTILRVVVIVFVCLWLLRVLGVMHLFTL